MTREFLDTRQQPTLERMVSCLGSWEAKCNAAGKATSDIGKWVQWRYEYLNEVPTEELVDKAVTQLLSGAHGIFHVSRALNINLALARRVLEAGVTAGKLGRVGELTYRAQYAAWAEADLRELEAVAAQRIAQRLAQTQSPTVPAIPPPAVVAAPVPPAPAVPMGTVTRPTSPSRLSRLLAVQALPVPTQVLPLAVAPQFPTESQWAAAGAPAETREERSRRLRRERQARYRANLRAANAARIVESGGNVMGPT